MKFNPHTKKIVTRILIALLFYATFIKLDQASLSISPSATQKQLGIIDNWSIPLQKTSTDIQPGENQIYLNPKLENGRHRLTFYYRCHPSCPEIWLTLPTHQNNVTDILVEHPIFKNLPMFHITNHTLSLYQPNINYSSIDSFLKNPPDSTILSDPILIDNTLPAQSHIKSLIRLQPDEKSYLLTTYTKPRLFGDWYEFTRIHDLSANQLLKPIPATISAFFSDDTKNVQIIPL